MTFFELVRKNTNRHRLRQRLVAFARQHHVSRAPRRKSATKKAVPHAPGGGQKKNRRARAADVFNFAVALPWSLPAAIRRCPGQAAA